MFPDCAVAGEDRIAEEGDESCAAGPCLMSVWELEVTRASATCTAVMSLIDLPGLFRIPREKGQLLYSIGTLV